MVKSSLAFLQPPVSSAKTKREMETNTRSEQTQSFLGNQNLQDGNSRADKAPSLWLSNGTVGIHQVVKEVKLIAQAKGVHIHQYLDDWLLRAPSKEICLQHTQILLTLCQDLGWVVNLEKSELHPQQDFNFVGYRFDLVNSRVLPTQDRWNTLQEKLKLKLIRNRPSCTVRQFMSLIGLLAATENRCGLFVFI